MPRNLVTYGFSREDGRAVGNILTEAQNLISRQKNDLSEKRAFLSELESIKQEVEKREEIFYRRMGVSDYNDLNNKLKNIQDAYAPLLADGTIITELKNRYDFTKITGASVEEIAGAAEAAFEILVEEHQELVDATFEQLGYKDVWDFVQKNFSVSEGSGRVVTVRGASKVGLGKIIAGYSSGGKGKKGKITITTDKVHFSSDFTKRMEKALADFRPNSGVDKQSLPGTKEEMRDIVNELVLAYTYGEAREYLRQTIINKSSFDLNRSLSSIIGYLGEIRAAALLKHLQIDENLARSYSVKGTGALRNAKTGQQIPIDLVCAGNGFQIKNYTLDDQRVTFSNTIAATTWIDNRMRLSGTLRDILIDLFGAYQYNQPFEDTEAGRAGLQEYIQMYNSIANGNNSLLYQLKDVFDSRIPSMLKMYENFSVGGDNTFAVEQIYFNTFFWVHSKLVPSSYILDRLIKQLNSKTEQIINSEYTYYEPSPSPSLKPNGKKDPSGNMLTMAKRVKITYDIEIDLSKII